MTSAYSEVGEAIYDFMDDLDITDIYEGGWGRTFNRVFSPDEVTAGDYPVFTVIPAEDEGTTLDSSTDADRIVYWVVISVSQGDVFASGEDNIRALVDLVRNRVKQERISIAPFGNESYDIQVSGIWGWDTERSERYYRLVITVNVAQFLDD